MAPLRVDRRRALAWRLRRQHLLVGAADATEVVRTLAAVSVFGADPDLSVRRRLAAPGAPGEVQRALADGRLVRTFSFRGSVQLMAPETAGVYLALRSAGRQWALRSWVEHYRLAPEDWPDLRAIVRDVVADGPVSPQAVADVLAGSARFAHLAREFAEPNHTFLKPFAWQGDVVLGPDLSALDLQSPAAAPGWAGVPDLEEAGPRAVLEYVDAYGPTTPAHVEHWLGGGLSAGRRRLQRWWDQVGDDLVEADVEGERRWLLAGHADDLASARPEPTVVLLPGKDDWVMGPGTDDTWVVPPALRPAMTRGAAPVVAAGTVAGTWRVRGDVLEVDAPPAPGLAAEATRLGALLGADLELRTP
ncbi:DNA glycosylase AlkZ-like family protein [Nocardioides sp. zg-1228]|uniref:DNA glycosylase AlkZ-like family protein n=1 Tax=Nocardioides sp. zg-1228 TaxID=2763008 RepID=UPI001642980B|nr:crosslink repair DNA glycosylase YcaQ family protein [Nocardioides sp. zg-1228]MBC2932671.1 winged helix DNA-binding domain-containing protein [Nocardioides sp. zg-1228]QSF58153.1 winged helix DNA-binding domain-containing protein [Nocardioides sp. zg-1228]